MIRRQILTTLALGALHGLLASPAAAQTSPNGFTVRHEVVIAAPSAEVYRSLVEQIGAWWNPSHTFSGDSKNLSIDARPGGCFCENFPSGGGVEHMRVVYLAPGEMLRLSGALGPLQAAGGTGSLTWKLTDGGGRAAVARRYEWRRPMSEPFLPRIGGVLSADIAVPEHERVVRFYSRVLGTGENPLWRDDLMNNLGIPIIGLGARSAEYAHLPLQWMPHIQVADVAESVRRALDLGGSELMHARDDDGKSQWAVLLDPNGAAFGVIPVVPPEAFPQTATAASGEATTPMGRIAWLDLTVSDASRARDFYREVVGWSVQEVELRDGGERYVDYNMLGADGTPAAGVCHARGENLGLPPVWLIYLPVSDLAESLRLMEEEGGRIIKVRRGRDGEYVYAVVQDPVGAYLALAHGGG